MRDFSWNVFTMTGNLDAYLLYKQFDELGGKQEIEGEESEEPEPLDS